MDILLSTERHIHLIRYAIVATSMLIFYEYAITIDNEVRYLWNRRVTLGGVLLGLGRYVPLVTTCHGLYLYTTRASSASTCLPGYIVLASLCYVEFLLPLFVLFFRTYAVWGGAKPALLFLVAVYMCFGGSTTYFVYAYVHSASVPLIEAPPGCLFVTEPNNLWYALVILIFCECLALALLVAKLFQHMNNLKNRPRRPTKDLLTVVARDGFGYFVCSLAVTTINLITLKHLTPDLRDFLIPTQGALQNILSNRLLFHVYSLHESRSR